MAGKQQADSPGMSWADSIGNAEALDRWRHETGYQVLTEDPSSNRVLPGVMPATTTVMPTVSLPGVRSVADSIVVTAKGAHTPNCTPAAIEQQLDESLSRLGLEQVPIYLLHRDNPDKL